MTRFSRPAPAAVSDAIRSNPLLRPESIDGTVLAPIVESSLARAATLPAVTPEAIEAARAERARRFQNIPDRGVRPFETAIAAPGRRVILEVKAASPSRGLMRAEIDLADYARVYGRYADAISCLTEPQFFGGSFERLADLRALTSKPLLAKDFIVSDRQLLAAYRAGADAALLMLSVLSTEGYRQLAAFAAELGLETLTEASTEPELHEAVELGARVIGINNRNLRTLEVDITRAPRLSALLPEGVVAVAESGYRTFAEIAAARESAPRIRAFLCGSALSESPNLSKGARELLFGHSKCCGITRPGDAIAAARAGAVTVGIILAARSKRRVAPEAAPALAREIRSACAAEGLPVDIAVVIDAHEAAPLKETIEAVAPEAIQTHGELTDQELIRLHTEFPGAVLSPAFGMGGMDKKAAAKLAHRVSALLTAGVIDRAVLDNSGAQGSGGTGKTFDFSLLAAFRGIPRVIVAGGISPENALAAVRAGAPGLDFNSGVETAPGVKSAEKLERAFAAMRGIA
ncbi:bifunctional indole-3-glycerol-phosphate synthase TrpC/phosphoribosylanthranilate isomerase TrpF [Sutterella sp.]|uniref:bifunctional indole-3-glycerol-phosphate synthase TrpC/phosphoribosylanthranilate isomerase TrpF n=1 Tax=Sutterella sp. TaxID=1981025 RepID=UPI0026DEB18F|nr:bifunctional indole-3-glycerol-phosphate synthase TrpC/phosphoribosylanthranilate isomerase TrpF [Sutterella sp.]MDO5531327.1 bifunctional indole-3-glycerol-phosphate synthase TrpC/phosphoribosylanthranilate isomerase TrpF [Sutterella sp.]